MARKTVAAMIAGQRVDQRGITLVELMIGTTVSLILLAGIIGVMLRFTVSGGELVQASRLSQQLRAALAVMTRDLQRAGYTSWEGAWPADASGQLGDANGDGAVDILDFYQAALPRINDFGPVRLLSFATPGDAASGAAECSADCDCILYSYDLNRNGQLDPGGGSFELLGFRWHRGAVEMRTAGERHECTSGTWQDMTDGVVEVTRLGFSLEYVDAADAGDATVYPIVDGEVGGPGKTCIPGAGAIADNKCLWRRKVAIDVEGRLASDHAVTLGLTSAVKLKNDHFQIQAPP
ncbi:MAG: prepilin-type N-terminal cleavage/methylation domain-containing protein [Porticoccaceae bacterium]